MTALLIALTLVEVVLLVAVLASYLVAIARSLRRTAILLGKVSFGVRAIEGQTVPIGPRVTRINTQLATIAAALDDLTGLAEAAGARSSRGMRRG
ncbi:MAG: hypothetical protein ACYCO3_07525 [Mycobacteriales bacterium]